MSKNTNLIILSSTGKVIKEYIYTSDKDVDHLMNWHSTLQEFRKNFNQDKIKNKIKACSNLSLKKTKKEIHLHIPTFNEIFSLTLFCLSQNNFKVKKYTKVETLRMFYENKMF